MTINYDAIKKLIDDFNEIEKSEEFKKYNEAMTKTKFIEPLFEALGWNIRGVNKSEEVTLEEKVSKGRVDYGFRLNGIPKFYLEAKSLKEKEIIFGKNYDKQAINYSWQKSCSWAVLTNFRTLAVYNADKPNGEWFFTIHAKDFLQGDRDKLELLSKEAFEQHKMDERALEWGKKPVKNPIDKQLLQDMIHFREILSRDIIKNNQDKHLRQEDIDGAVQRILDRLIFIRNAEDREMEENRLLSNVKQWSQKGKGNLINEISRVYKYYDEKYNSKLFEHDKCDDLYIDNGTLQEVIEGLNYSKDNSYSYDFSFIEADVLGNMYEQYLGNILKSTPKRAKLEQSEFHRKEQGIYYTPSYIVDYIVRNTVGEYIRTHTPEEIKKVRILDPACGSGSFLIRAYKELENYWTKELKLKEGDLRQTKWDIENFEQFYSIKTEILRNNIFGVDLDPKAVEIAQLNLLLQISEKGERLPLLQNNIKVGNSLVDDFSISDKAFKWEEKFPEIMKEGGFDIIIGNPPYVKEYTNREIFEPVKLTKLGKYYQGKMDIWYLFASLSIDLLKENGLHSFIAQNNWITSFGASKLREKILRETQIISFLDFGDYKVFPEADIQTMIYVLKKRNSNGSYLVDYYKVLDPNISEDRIKEFLKLPNIKREYTNHFTLKFDPDSFLGKEIVFTDESTNDLLTKIRKESNYFLNQKDVSTGIDVHQDFVIADHLKTLKDDSIKIGDGIFVIKKDELKKLNLTEKEMQLIKPYYTSSELTKYYGSPINNLYIIYTKSDINRNISEYPNIKKHLDKFKEIITSDFGPYGLHRSRKEEFFEGEKIISLRKTKEPTFTYVDFPCYVSQSFFVIKPRDVNLKLLTGILNSKVVYFWLKNKGKIQGNNLQIDKEPLINIPIKIPEKNSELEKSILNRVDEIIDLVKRMNTLNNSESTKEIIKERIEREKENLDRLIYQLYRLNESQISYIIQSL